MAKANTNAAGGKPDPTDAATGGDATGAQDSAGQGSSPPADAVGPGATAQLNTDTTAVTALTQPPAGESANALDAAISDVTDAAAEIVPAARQTLLEAVGAAAADAVKAGDHATHGVLNAIEVKLAELRNTIAASRGQVAEEYRHVLDWFDNLL
ncbi:hypothetical protein RA280_15340 [Cupriavidus sp. CV2]|uniref:hypothetical protein n=1 Tax=Cupriavidus ulmosensis TaxID=3065913 RepID=UPI00296A9A0D|nr:hypothetical protein [Cupriavidus sp. CV2]MDW3683099.1 hypothetical protein [Cupriavidus sp. CV2]